ncbi:Hypothetical protein ORPV_1000 [Orpheovirus IHUMI-LCC2]|uniref:Uncharacterized protein n=1 Tax=Orpheovirus IHUMI-LCC2 TaxID=2023057 RepID=A0A2I2L5T9_9VIRU|nr:Hypothetical protein ORPV_1000 [Orpheovirus IHUMI-LCC2]SNW62904.1 Hypothetical protein ORPV_1000 [Orpheovirus IHUMI-LCC2]
MVRVRFSLVFVFLVVVVGIKGNNICPYVVPGFQSCDTDADCNVYGANLECQKIISFAPGKCASKVRQCQYGSQECYKEGNVFNCHTPVGGSCTEDNQCLGQSYCVGGVCACNSTSYGYCVMPNGPCPAGTRCIGSPGATAFCLADPGSYCSSTSQCLGASLCFGCNCLIAAYANKCVSYTQTDNLIASYVSCVNGVIAGSNGACGTNCCSLAASVCASVIAPVRYVPSSSVRTDIANYVASQGDYSYYRSCEARYAVKSACGYRTDTF